MQNKGALGLFAIILLVVGLCWLGFNYTFVHQSKHADAQVVDVEYVPSNSARKGSTWSPVLQYSTAEGQIRARAKVGSSNRDWYHIGQQVRVYYNPTQPEDFLIDDFMNLYGFPLIPMSLAAIFGIIIKVVPTAPQKNRIISQE